MNRVEKSFEIERARDLFARKGEKDNLRKTYNKSNPSIPNLNTARLWDDLNSIKITRSSHPMAWNRFEIVTKLLKDHSKILDVGFGTADLEEIISNSYHHVDLFGIDISSKSVDRANDRFSKFHFSKGSIFHIPYRNNSFDFVVVLEVMEHIIPSKTFDAFKELWRVTKKNKYLVLSVPVNEGLEEMLKRNYNPNAHVRAYSLDLIKAEIEIAGFKVHKMIKLYAFHNHYKIKSLIINYFLKFVKKPNNIIVLCEKI